MFRIAPTRRIRLAGGAAAAAAIAAALVGLLVPVGSGTASTAAGYLQNDVTLYDGNVTSYQVQSGAPDCDICSSATLNLDTGAPSIFFTTLDWSELPAVEVGDRVRVWTYYCPRCGPTPTQALKIVSSRANSSSHIVVDFDVNFSPESQSWQPVAKSAGPVVALALGVLVCLLLIASEPTSFVAISTGGLMIAVVAAVGAVSMRSSLGGWNVPVQGLAFVAAGVAQVLGFLAIAAARRRRLSVSPLSVVAVGVGSILEFAVAAYWLFAIVAAGLSVEG